MMFRYVPERRLAYAVALAASLWLLPGRVGIIAGGVTVGIIAALALADILRLPAKHQLSIARALTDQVGIGDTVDGTYVIGNTAPRPLTVRVFDRMPGVVVGGLGEDCVLVPANEEQSLPFFLTGVKRGQSSLGPIGARVTTTLALIGARFRLAPNDDIRVVPSMSGVRYFRLLAMQNRFDRTGARVLRRKGDGQGFAGLREYALGDDPRHIDWKATSKKGKLITREFTIERSQTVFTLIDAGRSMTQLAGSFSRFEHALSSALVLTDIAATAGDRVGTCVFDDEIRAFVPALQSRGALQTVRDAFTPVAASTREPDYASAFRFLAQQQRKRALMVLFTDVIDVRASQALLAHVARSAARHLVLVIALRNDELFAAAVPGEQPSVAMAYEQASAEELIQAREDVLERMRRAGVVVVDVSPARMTAAVVNRYLELKARGAL